MILIAGVEVETKKKMFGNPYKLGFKWCRKCSFYIKWDGARCPICEYMLRTKSRSTKGKSKDRWANAY